MMKPVKTAAAVVFELPDFVSDPAIRDKLSLADRQCLIQQFAAAIVLLASVPAEPFTQQAPRAAEEPDQLISIKEVAERLGISTSWARQRHYPFRITGTRKYSSQGLELWIRRRRGL